MSTTLLGASTDPDEKAREVQEELSFPIAYDLTHEQAESMGAWWEERRQIAQPSEFILDSTGRVVSSTYSSGPVGRLMPEDAIKLIKFIQSQKSKA